MFAADSVDINPAVLGWIGVLGVIRTKMPGGDDDNLAIVRRLGGGRSTPGTHHCCPGQDIQLPALPFPFSCPLISPLLCLPGTAPSIPLIHVGVCSGHKPAHSCTATSQAGSGLRKPWISGPSAPGFPTSGSGQCWRAGAGTPPGAAPSPSSAAWSTTHSSGLGTRQEGAGLSPSQQPWHGAEHPKGRQGMFWGCSGWRREAGMVP